MRQSQDAGAALSRRDLVAFFCIAALAATVRLAFVASTPLSAPLSDMAEYWDRAVHLYQQGSLYPDSWRMPGVPVVLAVSFAGVGEPSLAAARSLNVLAGTITALLTYWLARRNGSRLWSTLAAVVVAAYPSLVVYTDLVATESVVTVPILGALVAASYSTRKAAAALGGLTGAAILVRPASVALVPAAIAAILLSPAGDVAAPRAARLALCLAAMCLALAPWWVRNYFLHRRFVPMDTTGGLNLLIGSGPLATGRWDWSAVARIQQEQLAGIDVATPEGADRASALAISHASAHVRDWALLIPSKLSGLLALEGREHAYLYSIGYFGQHTPRVVTAWATATLASFPLLTFAALAGLASAGAVNRDVVAPSLVFLLSAAALHLLSFGDPRFHLPFVPVMAVLATRSGRSPRTMAPRRALCLAALFARMLPAWHAQLSNYLDHLPILAAPGGWRSHVSFDDLL